MHRLAQHDLPTVARWLRYGLVGGAGTLLYMALVVLGVELAGLDPTTSALIAFIIMDVFIYGLNRSWVFGSRRRHVVALPRFVVVSLVGLVLNAGIMYATVHMLEMWYALGLVGATLIVPPTNYLLNAYWCFRETEMPRQYQT